ncbi:MAG TPA: ABC transporter substrate-binding protein, partial [Beijerinckiaceae bacterium]|nr:ABC transporter substrate-binding protein [Beijerinckiaceae bacterium]
MRRFILALALAAGLGTPALAQGIIRVAVGTTLNQLDPAKTTIGDEYIYVHLVFNGLTRIDRDLTVKPDLAVSWSASEDLKTWIFKLREGVKFHHGKTFDAEDVLATMNRILDPATGSRARANLTMIEKIEAPDPTTVRFTLNIPYAG